MRLAILFWFYKEPAICENRLKLFKKYNPDLKVYGLYGGIRKDANLYKRRLGKYLDDFYIAPPASSYWRWINGDLMILEWYVSRGRKFKNWDSIVVVQWDMLILDSLRKLFKGLKKGEVFLSGLRVINKRIENSWDWTKPGTKERRNFIKFLKYVRENYGYRSKPLVSLFILQVFPKVFFDKYLTVKNRVVGMLEYKTPIYAKIFGIPFYKKNFGVKWDKGKINRPLNALPEEIKTAYIKKQLNRKRGWRIFHPYYQEWPLNK